MNPTEMHPMPSLVIDTAPLHLSRWMIGQCFASFQLCHVGSCETQPFSLNETLSNMLMIFANANMWLLLADAISVNYRAIKTVCLLQAESKTAPTKENIDITSPKTTVFVVSVMLFGVIHFPSE